MLSSIAIPRTADQYAGCLLGGAIGDALGGPTEFMQIAEIRQRYGPEGQRGYVQLNKTGLAEFTDDTQMTLFTAEGLLDRQAHTGIPDEQALVNRVWQAYLRWLQTQDQEYPSSGKLTGLLALKPLWKRQAPGTTCLTALRQGRPGTPAHPSNNSKGCGGVMRAAPVGLLLPRGQAFSVGCLTAALTHGHPGGYLPSGVLAEIIAGLVDGLDLSEAISDAITILLRWPDHAETLKAIRQAQDLAQDRSPVSPEKVESLGGGWIGEEALAIGLYCALYGAAHHDLRAGMLLAINHSGDNDSTGSIAGNLLGALYGKNGLPSEWLTPLELRADIEAMALRLLSGAQRSARPTHR